MGDNEGHGDLLSNNLVILLIAMGSAAFVVSMYHVIAICWCNQRITNQNQQQQQRPSQTTEGTSLASVAHMIPTHRYSKKKVDSVVQGRSNCKWTSNQTLRKLVFLFNLVRSCLKSMPFAKLQFFVNNFLFFIIEFVLQYAPKHF